MPILTYRLVCSMDEIERRVRNRGLPQVETEVQRARQLVGKRSSHWRFWARSRHNDADKYGGS
jgi:hypothetical protein